MIRVVLDTNVVVSAQLKPAGLEATVLLLALRGDIALFVSPPILAEYQRVLYKPKLKFNPRRVEAVLGDIGAASRLVRPHRALMEAKHEPDNRFLECAVAAHADYLVTGNKKHFPKDWEPARIVNAREFIDQTAALDRT
jgi:putative PIN family toxin of toxin-antitoxin system